MEQNMKRDIKRLLYLQRTLDNLIHQEIEETSLRGKELDIQRFRESLIYHIDDNLEALEQHR